MVLMGRNCAGVLLLEGGETKVALISELCVVGTVVWYAGYKHVVVGERNHYFNGKIVRVGVMLLAGVKKMFNLLPPFPS